MPLEAAFTLAVVGIALVGLCREFLSPDLLLLGALGVLAAGVAGTVLLTAAITNNAAIALMLPVVAALIVAVVPLVWGGLSRAVHPRGARG